MPRSLGAAEQLQGKELSFNNILDLDAAWRLVRALSVAGAVVMKHNNPCGAACSESLVDAYVKARATDPVSAFGSVLGFNEPVDVDTAGEIVTTFVEAIAAPGFTSDALEILREKENLRLLNVPTDGELAASYAAAGFHRHDIRWVDGGLLVQDRDPGAGIPQEEWVCVTDRQPSDEEEAVREVQRNSISPRSAAHRYWCWPDEPCRFVSHRYLEGKGLRPPGGRRGGCLGRVLSFS